jgi:hypothetical protein
MPARDASMSFEEFKRYYEKNKGLIRSAKAYDASGRRWIAGRDIFLTPGAYTLIVLQFKDRTFLRINVKPSLKVAYAPEKYASASTWSRLGAYLTYEEKEFLESIGGDALSPDELVRAVTSSDFPGRDLLAEKLRKALEKMQR